MRIQGSCGWKSMPLTRSLRAKSWRWQGQLGTEQRQGHQRSTAPSLDPHASTTGSRVTHLDVEAHLARRVPSRGSVSLVGHFVDRGSLSSATAHQFRCSGAGNSAVVVGCDCRDPPGGAFAAGMSSGVLVALADLAMSSSKCVWKQGARNGGTWQREAT